MGAGGSSLGLLVVLKMVALALNCQLLATDGLIMLVSYSKPQYAYVLQ